eukprot:2580666-Lingulodinium_polyedra.AAC.1
MRTPAPRCGGSSRAGPAPGRSPGGPGAHRLAGGGLGEGRGAGKGREGGPGRGPPRGPAGHGAKVGVPRVARGLRDEVG